MTIGLNDDGFDNPLAGHMFGGGQFLCGVSGGVTGSAIVNAMLVEIALQVHNKSPVLLIDQTNIPIYAPIPRRKGNNQIFFRIYRACGMRALKRRSTLIEQKNRRFSVLFRFSSGSPAESAADFLRMGKKIE